MRIHTSLGDRKILLWNFESEDGTCCKMSSTRAAAPMGQGGASDAATTSVSSHEGRRAAGGQAVLIGVADGGWLLTVEAAAAAAAQCTMVGAADGKAGGVAAVVDPAAEKLPPPSIMRESPWTREERARDLGWRWGSDKSTPAAMDLRIILEAHYATDGRHVTNTDARSGECCKIKEANLTIAVIAVIQHDALMIIVRPCG